MLKNHTPFIGEVKLLFEKYPYWSNGCNHLNKVHLNLGFTKLVTRIHTPRELTGLSRINPEFVHRVARETGGKLMVHPEFGVVFTTKSGKFVGGVEDAAMYLKNRMCVDNQYPGRCALVIGTGVPVTTEYGYPNFHNLVGYYGYSHRGGATFKIGDTIFDPQWRPGNTLDYLDYWKSAWMDLSDEEVEKIQNEESFAEWCVEFIPFNRRGSEVIEDWEGARKAAVNLSKYLS
jgi:hypothetical protein